MKGFLVAGGSIPGFEHTKPGQPGWVNNQDAWTFRSDLDYLVGVVCDGCGSTPFPELGSRMGSFLVAKSLSRLLAAGAPVSNTKVLLDILEQDVLTGICNAAQTIDFEDGLDLLSMGFLFTIVGVAMGKDHTLIFSFGDGVVSLNGKTIVLEPAEDNTPAYIAYKVVSSTLPESALRFKVNALVPTAEVQSILIGTDGVKDLMAVADTPLPGKEELVGPLSQFWTNQKFVQNPDMIRRRLALAGQERVEDGHIRHGLLPDDTTFVVVQREKGT